MIIHRYAREKGAYVYLNDDVMLRGDGAGDNPASAFGSFMHQALLRMTVIPQSKMPSFLRIGRKTVDTLVVGEELALPAPGSEGRERFRFYAFGRGEKLGGFVRTGDAVAAAEADYGYVTDDNGCLVWCWKAKQESRLLTAAGLPAEPAADACDVSGSSLRAYMSFLDSGKPLLWISPDKGPLWLIGYEWQNGILYDPLSGETLRMTQDELEAALHRRDNTVWCPKT